MSKFIFHVLYHLSCSVSIPETYYGYYPTMSSTGATIFKYGSLKEEERIVIMSMKADHMSNNKSFDFYINSTWIPYSNMTKHTVLGDDVSIRLYISF